MGHPAKRMSTLLLLFSRSGQGDSRWTARNRIQNDQRAQSRTGDRWRERYVDSAFCSGGQSGATVVRLAEIDARRNDVGNRHWRGSGISERHRPRQTCFAHWLRPKVQLQRRDSDRRSIVDRPTKLLSTSAEREQNTDRIGEPQLHVGSGQNGYSSASLARLSAARAGAAEAGSAVTGSGSAAGIMRCQASRYCS
jgi:hypothetical protein